MMKHSDCHLETIIRNILCAKNANLYHHSLLTGEIMQELTAIVGEVEFTPEQAYFAGLVHDIGKLYVPDMTLCKQGGLTPREREVIQMHTLWGQQFAEEISCLAPYLDVIMGHHETPDGGGYPFGTTELSTEVRLAAVADQAAALLEDRVYRRKIVNSKYLCRAMAGAVETAFKGQEEYGKRVYEALCRVIETHVDVENRHVRLLRMQMVGGQFGG